MATALQGLQSLLLSVTNVQDFLQEAAQLGAGVLEPAASCSITVQRDGQPITVASSDERATLLDETQYEEDEGPCLQAMRTGVAVSVPNVATERRWESYTGVARKQGLQSSFSVPLAAHGDPLGAFNTYAFHFPRAFDDAQKQRLALFSAQAARAFQLVTQNTRNTELLTQLEQALRSRTVIDQALGILMGQRHCTTEEAFGLLRSQSQNDQRKLREVAADLVRDVSGQAPDPGKRFDTNN